LGLLFPIYGKIENVPNHQPEKYIPYPDVNHGAGIFTYKTGQILGHHGASGITNSSRYFYRLYILWIIYDIYIYMFMDLHGFIFIPGWWFHPRNILVSWDDEIPKLYGTCKKCANPPTRYHPVNKTCGLYPP